MSRDRLYGPRILVFIHDCPHGDEAVEVSVVKGWWGGPLAGSTRRELHRFCIPKDGDLESERIARALEAAAAAVRG